MTTTTMERKTKVKKQESNERVMDLLAPVLRERYNVKFVLVALFDAAANQDLTEKRVKHILEEELPKMNELIELLKGIKTPKVVSLMEAMVRQGCDPRTLLLALLKELVDNKSLTYDRVRQIIEKDFSDIEELYKNILNKKKARRGVLV
ncbi:hypothetical protein [Jeotgalibacillus soli]|uniref:Uncharacterized protein n=1 Tax=Jeotgalibacillus soli TaxID=889306 RepID=A0A0C2VP02_9BACL|nr:hypothetical protein [Jeotgalibacillus soli]KIL45733.1 hypothetical protein KP78_20820 [Jeotgalibacillus soli]